MKERQWLCQTCAQNYELAFMLAGIRRHCEQCGAVNKIAKYQKKDNKWQVYIPILIGHS